MIINANLSKPVYEYYQGTDLSRVVDRLLDTIDITMLPVDISAGVRYKEVKLNVTNVYYLTLYKTFGPRSKKVSLSRLLTYGMSIDILQVDDFKSIPRELLADKTSEEQTRSEQREQIDLIHSYLSFMRDAKEMFSVISSSLTDQSMRDKFTLLVSTLAELITYYKEISYATTDTTDTTDTTEAEAELHEQIADL